VCEERKMQIQTPLAKQLENFQADITCVLPRVQYFKYLLIRIHFKLKYIACNIYKNKNIYININSPKK